MARYGRRFFRRRGFGGRRRFVRRRPNAARAVPRTTLAPRHQFLKLKGAANMFCIQYSSTSFNFSPFVAISLSSVADWLFSTVTTPVVTPSAGAWYGAFTNLLGFGAYSNLFQEYVLNAAKIRVSYQVKLTQPVNTAVAILSTEGINYPPCTLYRSYAPFDESDFPSEVTEWAAMPFGRQVMMVNDRPVVDKVYVNCNRLWGTRIRNRDRYVRAWADERADVPADARAYYMARVGMPINGSSGNYQGYTIAVSIQVVYYLTAQAVYSKFAAPSFAEASMLASAVSGPPLGDSVPTLLPSELANAHTGSSVDAAAAAYVGTLTTPSVKRAFEDTSL